MFVEYMNKSLKLNFFGRFRFCTTVASSLRLLMFTNIGSVSKKTEHNLTYEKISKSCFIR